MLQFSCWFWSPNDWKPHQVLLLVMPTPNKWNTISLLQYNLQMNVQLPSWTKGLWHLLLTNQSTELSDSKIVLHVKAHKVLKLSRMFLFPLFSRLICQHYLSLLAWTSKSVWCLPKGRKLVCHDLSVTFFNPLGFRKRMHKSEKKTHWFGEKWLWGPLNNLLYSWRSDDMPFLPQGQIRSFVLLLPRRRIYFQMI